MQYTKRNIIGLVILYNSKERVIENIKSYINQIDCLIVIDNSEIPNLELISRIEVIPGITYIANNNNLGIAHALNQAADIAIKAEYQFLLTMDDDTYFPINGIQKMLDYVNQHSDEKFGIIASQSEPDLFNNDVKLVPYTITSGNLLNLSAYRECGRFLDEFFIDFVDHEYCFRLKEHGYSIVEINYVHLSHNLGSEKQLWFYKIKIPVSWTSHNPLRIYYKTRNCIFSLKKYSDIELNVKITFYKVILKDFLKILFLENKKYARILLFIQGIYDGLVGNLGKKTEPFER